METFGKRLKRLRGKRTQEQISKLLGVHRASYSHYENHHVEPTLSVLKKMAKLYGVTVDYLLEGVE